MNCKLTIKNPALSAFLDQSEFSSLADFEVALSAKSAEKEQLPFLTPNGYVFLDAAMGEDGYLTATTPLPSSSEFSQKEFTFVVSPEFARVSALGFVPLPGTGVTLFQATNVPQHFMDDTITANNLQLYKDIATYMYHADGVYTDTERGNYNELIKKITDYLAPPQDGKGKPQSGVVEGDEEEVPKDMEQPPIEGKPEIYIYTVGRIYDTLTDTIPDNLSLTKDPMNSMRNRVAAQIERDGKNYQISIEKDSPDNAQVQEGLEMGVVGILLDENGNRLYISKKTPALNDPKAITAPVIFTTDPSDAAKFGYNNSPVLTHVIPIIVSPNYRTETGEEVAIEAQVENARIRALAMAGTPVVFDVRAGKEQLPLPKEMKDAWNIRTSLALKGVDKERFTLSIDSMGFLQLEMDGNALNLYGTSLSKSDAEGVKFILNNIVTKDQEEQLWKILKSLYPEKNFFFKKKSVPSGYQYELWANVEVKGKINYDTVVPAYKLSTAQANKVLKEATIRPEAAIVNNDVFVPAVVNGQLTIKRESGVDFYLRNSYTRTRLVKTAPGLQPSLIFNHVLEFTTTNLKLPQSANLVEDPQYIGTKEFDGKEMPLEDFLNTYYEEIMKGATSDLADVMTIFHGLITQGQVSDKLFGTIEFSDKISTGVRTPGKVIINKSLLNNPQGLARVLTHELVHVFVDDWIKRNPIDPITLRLKQLIKDYAGTLGLSDYQKTPQEFLAQITDPQVVNSSKDIFPKGILTQFLDIVKEILAKVFPKWMDNNDPSLYEEMIDKVVTIATNYKEVKTQTVGKDTFIDNTDSDYDPLDFDISGYDEGAVRQAEAYLREQDFKVKSIVQAVDAELARVIHSKGLLLPFLNKKLNPAYVYYLMTQDYGNWIKAHNAGQIKLSEETLKLLQQVIGKDSYNAFFTVWVNNTRLFEIKKTGGLTAKDLEILEQQDQELAEIDEILEDEPIDEILDDASESNNIEVDEKKEAIVESVEGDDSINNRTYDRSGFEKSVIDSSEESTRTFIRMLPQIERIDGNVVIYSKEQIVEAIKNGMPKEYITNIGENQWIKWATDDMGRLIPCNYTQTYNQLAELFTGRAPLHEKLNRIDLKILNALPEAFVLKSRLKPTMIDPKSDDGARFIAQFERSFARFRAEVAVVLKTPITSDMQFFTYTDTNGEERTAFYSYSVKNESKDIRVIASNKVNSKFGDNLFNDPKMEKHYEAKTGMFKMREYLEENGYFDIAFEDIQDPRIVNLMSKLGFDIDPSLHYSPIYNDFKKLFLSIFDPATEGGVQEININLGSAILSDDQVGKGNGLKGAFTRLFAEEDKRRPLNSTMVVLNADGEMQATMGTGSSLLQDKDIYNDTKTLEELNKQIGRTKNPMFKFSLARRLLYDDIGQKSDRQIQILNWNGSKEQQSEGGASRGALTIDLEEAEWMIMNMVGLFREGLVEHTRAETANTSYAFRMSSWRKSGDAKTPVTMSDVVINDSELSFGASDVIYTIFSNYLKGELLRKIESGKDFSIFHGISDELYQKLVTSYNKAEGEFKVNIAVNENEEDVIQEIKRILNREIKQYKEIFSETVGSLEDIGDTNILKHLADTNKVITPDRIEQMFAFTAINMMVLHVEEMILFHGDVHRLPKYFKRAKSIQSTGIAPSSNPDLISKVNEKNQTNSFGALTGKPLEISDSYKTSVINDHEAASYFAQELTDTYKQSVEAFYNKAGLPIKPDEVDDVSKKLKKAYEKVNIGDGAAIMHPDFYRSFLELVGKWTPEMDHAFNYLIFKESGRTEMTESEKLGQDLLWSGKVTFPILKLTQRGNIVDSDSFLQEEIMDKFALVPGFPSVLRDKPVGMALYNEMINTGQAYIKFESASKLSRPGQVDFIKASEEGKAPTTVPYSVHMRNLREQISTPETAKEKTILGSQFRELLVSGIFDTTGRALKLSNEQNAGQLKDEWINTIQQYTTETIKELLGKFGLDIDPYIVDGVVDINQVDFSGLDMVKVLDVIIEKIDKEDLPENILSYYTKLRNDKKAGLDSNYQYFEGSFASGQIENLFASIVKKIVTQKIGGTQLIQTPSSFFTSKSHYDNPRGTNDLRFYRWENGVYKPAECKISMMGEFKNLLNIPEINQNLSMDEKLDALNLLLKDDGFVSRYEKQLTFVAYRIPTQGYNSMEVLTIREFLPPYMSPAIVTPPEITVKSGTDYDYDKLTAIFPSILPNGLLRETGNAEELQSRIEEVVAQRDAQVAELTKEIEFLNWDSLQDQLKEIKGDIKMFNNLRKDVARLIKMSPEEIKEFGVTDEDILEDATTIKENLDRLTGDKAELIELVNYLIGLQKDLKSIKETSKQEIRNLKKQIKPKGEKQTKLVQVARDILLSTENIYRLITPNSIDLISEDKDSPEDKLNALLGKMYDIESIKEPKHYQLHGIRANFLKWRAVKMKQFLGIAAVNNRFFSIVQNHALPLNPTYNADRGRVQKTPDGVVSVLDQIPAETKFPSADNSRNLYIPTDTSGVQKLELLNQLINITVDAASDDRFGYLDLTLNDFDAIMFMNISFGVPLYDLLYFLHTPEIMYLRKKTKEITKEIGSREKAFILALKYFTIDGYDLMDDQFTSSAKLKKNFLAPFLETAGVVNMDYIRSAILPKSEIEKFLFPIQRNLNGKLVNMRSADQLTNAAVYYKMLEMTGHWASLKGGLNFDSSPDSFILKVYNREEKMANIREADLFPREKIEEIEKNSTRSALKTGRILTNLTQRAYPLLYRGTNLAYFKRVINELNTEAEKEKMYRKVTSDFLLSILQSFGKYKGESVYDMAREMVVEGKSSELHAKTHTIKAMLAEEGISLKLLNLIQASITNPKESNKRKNIAIPLGYENSPKDKNQLTDEFRYLLNHPNPTISSYAEAVAIVGMVQSGWAKSPIYYSDLIPEEFATRILYPAFEHYDSLSDKSKRVYIDGIEAKSNSIKGFSLKFSTTLALQKTAWRFRDLAIRPEKPMVNQTLDEEILGLEEGYVEYEDVTPADPTTPTIPLAKPVKKEPIKSAGMTYAYQGNQIEGFPATTMDAVISGQRTATTRYESQGNIGFWKAFKEGDLLEFVDKRDRAVTVRITKPLTKLDSDLDVNEWSQKEGWTVDYFEKNVRPKLKEAWQIEFEIAENQPSAQADSANVEITANNYTRPNVQGDPNTAYVFTENTYSITAFPNRVGGGSALIRGLDNAYGIVTKKKYDYDTKENVDYSDIESDFKEFTSINTELINKLKNSGKSKIVFPQGFATDKAKMPTRFALWLQKELLDNFGLVTELNSTKTGLISKSVITPDQTLNQDDNLECAPF